MDKRKYANRLEVVTFGYFHLVMSSCLICDDKW